MYIYFIIQAATSHQPQLGSRCRAPVCGSTAAPMTWVQMIVSKQYGFVWKCWVNIPNEIAIFHRDKDQQNHWVQWGLAYFQTHPYTITSSQYHANSTEYYTNTSTTKKLPSNAKPNVQVNYFLGFLKPKNASALLTRT